MICPACEGDMFLPQYDEKGDLNHFSECWLCDGRGIVARKKLPLNIKIILSQEIQNAKE